MKVDKLTLVIEGADPPLKRVRVKDLIRELNLLLNSLSQIETGLRPSPGENLFYHIVELSYGSPATVGIEPIPYEKTIDSSHQVHTEFCSIVRRLEKGESLKEKVPDGLLESLLGMAAPVGKTLSSVKILAEDESFILGQSFHKKVEELLRPEETYPGFIRGMLEAINVHGGINIFRIYPDIGPVKVTCHFPTELQNSAVGAIGRFVEVRGTLKYKVTASFPHEVEVSNLETFPDELELPKLNDLRGIAPKATGEQSSEDFIRDVRNAAG